MFLYLLVFVLFLWMFYLFFRILIRFKLKIYFILKNIRSDISFVVCLFVFVGVVFLLCIVGFWFGFGFLKLKHHTYQDGSEIASC